MVNPTDADPEFVRFAESVMKSFGAMLAGYGGFGPGFNFLRISLAFSIVFYHVLTNSGHSVLAHGPVLWFLEYSLALLWQN